MNNEMWMKVKYFVLQNYPETPCKQFDCSVFRSICASMNVTEFPLIALVVNASATRTFNGPLEIEDMKAFVVEVLGEN